MAAFINRLSSARALLNWLKTVDGTGSGLDADTVDGVHVASGTYTPTYTGTANVDSITAGNAYYTRVGNIVHVAVYATVDATAAASTLTTFGISLPIASNFAAVSDASGVSNTGSSVSGSVRADTTNDRAVVNYLSASATAESFNAVFSYEIK